MDDLISRQEVIDRLSEVLSSEEEFEKAKQVIIEAPTDYNVDKVKKYFEDKINAVKQTPYINDYLQNLGMQTVIVTIIDDLLRIVKKGDVDDEIDIPFW